MNDDTRRTVEALWRIESPRLVARLARTVGDVSLAEELAQDAFVAALDQWPVSGVPDNPAAWLMTVAKRRGVDTLRRQATLERKHALLIRELGTTEEPGEPEGINDDLLRLIFVACHPVLSREAKVALTLKLLGGLTTAEIARAFLVTETTVAQRIVRAKRTLTEAGVPFEVPGESERHERLCAVLEVIYLIFNEGYSATSGDDWLRPALCTDALRLGRVLAGLTPRESEVHGLVALMEIQASRTAARTTADGEPVLLLDQDRNQWDRLLIDRGLVALARAQDLGALGTYGLQAAIAACHAQAPRAEDTPWPKIAALYEALSQLAPSPVVELNKAVALSMAFGPLAGLDIVDAIADEPSLKGYHLLPAVRGDLLTRLGRAEEAHIAFETAASLARNERERELLLDKARLTDP